MVTERIDAVFESPAAGLRAFLDTSKSEDTDWGIDDRGAVLRHQWSAPLTVDLTGLDAATTAMGDGTSSRRRLIPGTFGELLAHAHPPVELLILVKDFAKRSLFSPFSELPHDVARVLYFASIAAAVVRCGGHRISTLDDGGLRRGMEWCLAQEWINEAARDVLRSGLASPAISHIVEQQ